MRLRTANALAARRRPARAMLAGRTSCFSSAPLSANKKATSVWQQTYGRDCVWFALGRSIHPSPHAAQDRQRAGCAPASCASGARWSNQLLLIRTTVTK